MAEASRNMYSYASAQEATADHADSLAVLRQFPNFAWEAEAEAEAEATTTTNNNTKEEKEQELIAKWRHVQRAILFLYFADRILQVLLCVSLFSYLLSLSLSL